jgi:hypothetical protein
MLLDVRAVDNGFGGLGEHAGRGPLEVGDLHAS